MGRTAAIKPNSTSHHFCSCANKELGVSRVCCTVNAAAGPRRERVQGDWKGGNRMQCAPLLPDLFPPIAFSPLAKLSIVQPSFAFISGSRLVLGGAHFISLCISLASPSSIPCILNGEGEWSVVGKHDVG